MKITLLTGKTFDFAKELGFDIHIIHSNVSKRLTLRINAKKRIPVLSIPKHCSNKKALAFAREHLDWIKNNLHKLPSIQKFNIGSKITLFGQELLLEHSDKRGVVIEDNCLKVSGETQFFHRRVRDFIKDKAKSELKKISTVKAKTIGEKINNIVIKDTTSRWGSCSSNKNINYSWRIALAPYFVIDYLVAHEVAHLKHQDHSRNFWETVKQLCPEYLHGKNWLKNHGKSLYIYE